MAHTGSHTITLAITHIRHHTITSSHRHTLCVQLFFQTWPHYCAVLLLGAVSPMHECCPSTHLTSNSVAAWQWLRGDKRGMRTTVTASAFKDLSLPEFYTLILETAQPELLQVSVAFLLLKMECD